MKSLSNVFKADDVSPAGMNIFHVKISKTPFDTTAEHSTTMKRKPEKKSLVTR
jgi:hypothetical protein